jgi:hypothetical protein
MERPSPFWLAILSHVKNFGEFSTGVLLVLTSVFLQYTGPLCYWGLAVYFYHSISDWELVVFAIFAVFSLNWSRRTLCLPAAVKSSTGACVFDSCQIVYLVLRTDWDRFYELQQLVALFHVVICFVCCQLSDWDTFLTAVKVCLTSSMGPTGAQNLVCFSLFT